MGINLRWASSPLGTKNIGPVNMGGGANMIERSLFASNTPALPYSQWYVPGNGSPALSTSDYYLINGWYWSIPYDLDTMGSDGATIKAREGGKRYVWIIGPDHGFTDNFQGGSDFYAGYSDDPQIFPDPATLRSIRGGSGDSVNIVDKNGWTQNSFFVYQVPHLVYNPDPGALAPFYIYAEGVSTSGGRQHQLGLFTSTDLLSSTLQGPAIPTTTNSGWTSYGAPTRLGVSSWEVYCFGKIDGSGPNPTPSVYRYTSTDGWDWTPNYTNLAAAWGPYFSMGGNDYILSGDGDGTNDYLAYFPVDANKAVTGPAVRISTGFGEYSSAYPTQTTKQDTQMYIEDGVASIQVARGFPPSNHDRTNAGPYLENVPHVMSVQGSIASTGGNNGLLTTSATPPYPLLPGFRLKTSGDGQIAGLPRVTVDNGDGTYNIAGANPVPTLSGPFNVIRNGGLWHQMIDQYFLITDATAAASAAPLGVKADCAAGVVTISWNNCLPHQNYRVYRGTTAGTQATLIGTISGTSITDTPTPGAQYFYKVVTMNGGEQKSRIVNVYASNNALMYNRHYNRVINDGGDTTKIDPTFLATAVAWLTTNDCWRYVNWWIDARFGVKLDGSGFVSKIYCLGTTYLPRGGDYTPTTSNTFPSTSSNTSYSSNSFRGTTPSWINNASSAHGYFGNGRVNNIQRWNEITLLAAYQKPGTGGAALFGLGQFGGFNLTHASGSNGNISFSMAGKVTGGSSFLTATVPFSNATAAGVAAGVQRANGDLLAYLNGTPGTPVSTTYANPTLLNDSVLRGGYTSGGAGSAPVLTSGSSIGMRSGTYTMDSSALFTGAALAAFNKDLGTTLIGSWGALYA